MPLTSEPTLEILQALTRQIPLGSAPKSRQPLQAWRLFCLSGHGVLLVVACRYGVDQRTKRIELRFSQIRQGRAQALQSARTPDVLIQPVNGRHETVERGRLEKSRPVSSRELQSSDHFVYQFSFWRRTPTSLHCSQV